MNQPVLGNLSMKMNEILNHSTNAINHAPASEVGIVSELLETAAIGAAIGFLVNDRDPTLA